MFVFFRHKYEKKTLDTQSIGIKNVLASLFFQSAPVWARLPGRWGFFPSEGRRHSDPCQLLPAQTQQASWLSLPQWGSVCSWRSSSHLIENIIILVWWRKVAVVEGNCVMCITCIVGIIQFGDALDFTLFESGTFLVELSLCLEFHPVHDAFHDPRGNGLQRTEDQGKWCRRNNFASQRLRMQC